MTTFTKQLRSTAGYTIDQMILVIAIIAILVTLVIVSVGWNLINRTSGAKLANQVRQVEDQNGQFYSNFRVWPHQAYTDAVSAARNIVALTGSGVTYSDSVPAAQRRNFIPGFRVASTGTPPAVSHNFSNVTTNGGNTLTQAAVTSPFGLNGTYMVVQFANVPFAEAIEAELAIDGGTEATVDFQRGRFAVTASAAATCIGGTVATAPTIAGTNRGSLVNVCYAANLIQ